MRPRRAGRPPDGVGFDDVELADAVVAGLADIATQQTFTGTSGAYPYLPATGKQPGHCG
ncbi:hypothetical protein [Microtetraspora fusca]|uniref:hypothetical protein n=1 Tax=Microtetraspora fusca TaxID=1997 RepID=UPI000AED9850|nr:hypothetical protein [Microtetraspora fusca]